MNAIERSDRRVRRRVVLKNIYDIEQKYCRKCPNRKSEDRTFCEVCPVMKKLNVCGDELIKLSTWDRPVKISETTGENVKRKPGRPTTVESEISTKLTRELFLQERINGMWVREIQLKYQISRTTLQYRLKKWGFRYLSQAQAKKILEEGTA